MDLYQHQNRLYLGFIILSLLAHLLLLLIPHTSLFPQPARPEPVYVEVRPLPRPDLPRELDIPIREELQKPRETPAERLGPADQVVKQETAPQGNDFIDQPVPGTASKPAPAAAPTPKAKTHEATDRPVGETNERVVDALPTPHGSLPPQASPPPSREMPDLERLTQISPQTLASIESDWRRKYRHDVAEGDTVWLDTQNDLLNSFMRRFRDNIYLVWDYPAEAQRLLQQGTCLLKITVDRRGDVISVHLLESSGFPLLDREAIDSVRQGATYGPLPSLYPNETLKIMAFFQYGMSEIVYRRRVY